LGYKKASQKNKPIKFLKIKLLIAKILD